MTQGLESNARSRTQSRGSSALVLLALLLVAAIAGAALYLHFRRAAPVTFLPEPARPAEFTPAVRSLPVGLKFVNVTREAGIHFRHVSGARGKKLLPETMGGGCAVLDFDRDGDPDLLFINSCHWAGDEPPGPPPTQALYANDGKGRFTDVTREVGLALSFHGMGAAIGDYNGDGFDDVFFTGVGGERLFKNVDGKRFEETTQAAGVAGGGQHTWSTGAAFLDYDGDGMLDLFFCRYVEWTPEADLAQAFQITGLDRAYGPPMNFPGTFSRLLRNVGGKFEDVSAKAGLEVRNSLTDEALGKGLGAAVHDLNEDGWPDIAVANDTVQNFLFLNKKDGTFEEIGILSGFAFDESGKTRGAMGIDCADSGSSPGSSGSTKMIVVGNFANEITALYRSSLPGELPFSDDATAEGIGNPSRKHMKFGVFFFDLDLDGRPDIFEANGHLESEIEKVQAEQRYAQPVQVFWNAGPGAQHSYEVLGPERLGPDLFEPVVGRGCAYADFDGDGDLDVVLCSNNGEARLFRNDGGNKNRWIRLKLVGNNGNTNAFGARVTAEVAGKTLKAQLTSGRSYLSQCEQVITLGLGQADRAENVKIYWPGQMKPENLGTIPEGTLKEIRSR